LAVTPVSATGKYGLPADDIGSLPMKKREGLACLSGRRKATLQPDF
jgi:hypothetical protein